MRFTGVSDAVAVILAVAVGVLGGVGVSEAALGETDGANPLMVAAAEALRDRDFEAERDRDFSVPDGDLDGDEPEDSEEVGEADSRAV